ncbi:hypothetical protein [Candidatus Methanomassiliicoccus intestinalis]|uniref:hypothetical protein n=1 Tax=Candidatus Methanomassiliicoccus intestinalis TaxID=1406512 RepID=UPI0037DC74DD
MITNNWNIAGPILTAGIVILGAYGTLLMVNSARLKMSAAAEMAHKTIIASKNAMMSVLNMTLFAYRMKTDAAAAAAWRQSIAMYAASGGMMGFAAAAWMAAAPLLPFIAASLLVVGAIYLIVFAFNKFTGSSISATGIITGALYSLYAVFYNVFAGILNFGMKVVDILTGSIEKLVNGIIGGLNWVINALNYIPGVNIKTIGKVDMGFDYDAHKIAYKDVGAYYNKGYGKGEGLANSVGGMFSLTTPDVGDLTTSSEYEQLLSGIQSNTEQIADNTELTTDDIDALIDLTKTSYRERVNVVTVNYTATFDQKISKDADVDGVVREIERSLNDALNNGGKGVHSY